jgi:hypothetical protein
MSSQPGPKQSANPADDEHSESVVGVYERPEQRGPQPLMMIIIVLVIIALVAGLVIWVL